MVEALVAVATFILACIAIGLVVMWRRAGAADQMMSVQLFGTGGVAILLLLGVATGQSAVLDVALLFALLAAFGAAAFHGAAGDRRLAADRGAGEGAAGGGERR